MKKHFWKQITFSLFSALCLLSALPMQTQAQAEQKIYGIGSVGKVFGAAAVMKLADQGKLDLDAPVIDYIPEFEMADERYTQITVRMLLNHSSGIMGTTYNDCFLLGESDSDYHTTLLSSLKTQTLKADPGEYSVYCNDGFTLAEIVVERVSGMRFGDFLEQEFSQNLEMKHTFMPSAITGSEALAPTYFKGRLLPYENIKSLASGGIYSTPEDVCRFSQIFMNQGNALLSKESVEAMAFPEYKNNKICVQEGDSSFGYGLGWDSVDAYPYSAYGITALMKGGDSGRYHTGLTVLPEQNLSVCVTSSGDSTSTDCQAMAQAIIMEVLKENDLLPQQPENVIQNLTFTTKDTSVIPDELKKYAGIYASTQMLNIEFTQNNTLLLTSLENESDLVQEYVYTPEGYFVSTNGNCLSPTGPGSASGGVFGITKFRFSEEGNGKTYMLGSTYLSSGAEEQTAFTMPLAEKVSANEVSTSVKEAWAKRNEKKYYLISEAYNSSYYLTLPCAKIETLSQMEGYTAATASTKNCRIIDENNAICDLDLPVMLGRDLKNYEFYQNSEQEYLSFGGYTFLREDFLSPSSELTGDITVGKTGTWYSVLEADAGMEIKIDVPKGCAYYIYDKDDTCLASSIFLDEKSVVLLPENGKVLLLGAEGSIFRVNR